MQVARIGDNSDADNDLPDNGVVEESEELRVEKRSAFIFVTKVF